ncbi:peptide-methionine (S)-S-oxide reductase [Enterobacter hormaechei]|uniref:peptide-methionine (S)-S-oxide reductase n=1 Tax=Enterobacter hormaechei TaxID=158836 RepID=UPI002FE52D99
MHTTTTLNTIGLGGGCHWCTEGVFSSLIGIATVNQGWIASIDDNAQFSEAIEVVFDPTVISLSTLIETHLHTHASTSNHSMRGKYRSAIYAYDEVQYNQAVNILDACRADFEQPVITQVYFFKDFKANKTELIDYFYTAPNRPFCQRYIHPKLTFLLARFSHYVDTHKLTESGVELTSI